jgi:cytochrome P450
VPPELVREFEHYDLPGVGTDPFPVFDEIAAETPPIFYSSKLGGFWVVTRYADVFEVYRDNKRFSSRSIGVPAAVMPYALKPLQSDPPDHAKFRRILDPAFTRQKMETWNPKIREISRDLVLGFKDKGECEFISEFAQYLPNRIFMAMAGLPEDRFDEFMEWEKALLHGETPEARYFGMQSIENFVAEHFIGRRGQPRRDDLTDVVAHAEIDGQPLSDEDIKSVGFLLYIAGLDTVQAMTGFAFRHLAIHQDDQLGMRASDEARARGLEEILRLHGIVASGRTVIADMNFKGVEMKAGDRVLCFAGFGNRDPAKFPRGGTSDITPKLNPHLTFGAGPHLCLGMHLARNELNIAMDEMFRNVPQFRLQRPAVTHAGGVCGVDELYLEW